MKRRMSIERLAEIYIAITDDGVMGDLARNHVTLDDAIGVEIGYDPKRGPTFAATLDLNRERFDYFEASPYIRRLKEAC